VTQLATRTCPPLSPLYKSRRQNCIIITSSAALLTTSWTTIFKLWRTSSNSVVSLQV